MKNTLLCLSLFVSFSAILYSQTDKELAAATITKNKIESHIYFLASDELRGRETGTNENKIAAQYLANTLRSYGVKQVPGADGFFQPVPLKKTTTASKKQVVLNGKDYSGAISISGSNFEYNGNAVYLNYGLEKDYIGKDVKGKIVILKAGTAPNQQPRELFEKLEDKRELAIKNGVLAVIEIAPVNDMVWQFLGHNFNEDKLELVSEDKNENNNAFNYIWLQDENGAITIKLSEERLINSQVTIQGVDEIYFNSRNVIGMVEGTDPKLKEEFIIYSGHYDHVGIGMPDVTGDSIYNGARDNAVGVTTVLAMAENLAKYPTKRSALFILFTGEEKGLLGSSYYVENALLPLKQMVFCFNSDNAGYNDTSLVTIVGLGRTTAETDFKVAASAFGLQAVDDPAPEQNLFDRSDNVHFARKGIPAPTYSMGFSSFSGEVTEHYHQPSDEAHTLDYDYLVLFFKSYVLSGRLIANNPLTPFWKVGDKYKEAGKALYPNR